MDGPVRAPWTGVKLGGDFGFTPQIRELLEVVCSLRAKAHDCQRCKDPIVALDPGTDYQHCQGKLRIEECVYLGL